MAGAIENALFRPVPRIVYKLNYQQIQDIVAPFARRRRVCRDCGVKHQLNYSARHLARAFC